MEWPEDLSNDLPTPRPDEPPTLRSDILDELRDHLQASLEHEQIKGSDEQTAQKSVLSRFGNPSTIACQLWWDAMWGKIMIQRITLSFVAVLSMCAIAATYLIWQAVQQSQQVTVALVEEVKKLSEQSQPSPVDERMKYLEWIPVTVKLQYENGAPVTDEKFVLKLSGDGLLRAGGKHAMLQRQSGSTGKVDFGFVKPGEMNLTVSAPWNEYHNKGIVAAPGNPLELTITCPREPPSVPANLSVDWPDDLRQHNLWTYLWLQPTDKPRSVGNSDWKVSTAPSKQLIISPSGEVCETNFGLMQLDPRQSPQQDALFTLSHAVPDEFEKLLLKQPRLRFRQIEKYLPILDKSSFQIDLGKLRNSLNFPTQECEIDLMWVMKKSESSELVEETPRFRVILPVAFFQTGIKSKWSEEASIQSDDWTYHPSKDVANLVRKRLEQIDKLESEETNDDEPASATAETLMN